MNPRILVVDDHETTCFTFERFLTAEGYEVKTANTFYDALSRLGEDRYDLVFADIMLGGKTGIDILRSIREKDSALPVVLITGYPEIGTASDAVRLSAFDYITKPVEKDAIIRLAKQALNHKASFERSTRCRRNLEAIFRSVRHPIIAVDERVEVMEFNEAAKKLIGLTRDDIGKPMAAICPGCGRQYLEALEQTVQKNRTVDIHRFECRGKDGEKHAVSLSSLPLLAENGDVCGAVLLLKDPVRVTGRQKNPENRGFMDMVGRSGRMQEIYRLIQDLADSQSTVLVTGESGTGKELVGAALHTAGRRRDKPYIKVNLPALPESLIESELFGHVKGAFTGAVCDKPGRFQLAHGGSIFLDEIGDLSPKTQVSLLRVLQEKEFERVGDPKPIRVDVRVIAATNQDLQRKIERGEFREDLYYRLKVVELRLPPLRERKKDIPLLVDHFLEGFSGALNKRIEGISEDALELLMQYRWPGNVRELKHTLEHACILCRESIITPEFLPSDFIDLLKNRDGFSGKNSLESEREAILCALEKTAGNKTKAAVLLGIGRQTIYRRIAELGLNGKIP